MDFFLFSGKKVGVRVGWITEIGPLGRAEQADRAENKQYFKVQVGIIKGN